VVLFIHGGSGGTPKFALLSLNRIELS